MAELQRAGEQAMRARFDPRLLAPYFEEFGLCLQTLVDVAESLDRFRELGEEHPRRKRVEVDRREFFYVVMNNRRLVLETAERMRVLLAERLVAVESGRHLNDLVWAAAGAAQEAQARVLALQSALGLPLVAYRDGRRQPLGRM